MAFMRVSAAILSFGLSITAAFGQVDAGTPEGAREPAVELDQDSASDQVEPFDFDHGNTAVAADQCRRFDGSELRCRRNNCLFDSLHQICVSRRPGGQPSRPQYYCQQFNYNQYQCQANGCFYDVSSRQCFAQGGNPRPNPTPGRGFVCTAVDAGWEEHRVAHQGIGRTQYDAQQAALGDCMRYHGRCRVTSCQPY